MRLLKCSGADVIPKGSRLKRYLPKGVMKVVSKDDYFVNSICQNPEFASSFENTVAPPS